MEKFRDIPDYEGIYQVSNYGRVKSLARRVDNQQYTTKERILKPCINTAGYLQVILNNNKAKRTARVHQLVAITFLSHTLGTDKVVDHKNNNKLDNRVENLQVTSIRLNSAKEVKNTGERSSIYVGVSWHSKRNKWRARIRIQGKNVHLGYYTNELEAGQAYLIVLKQIVCKQEGLKFENYLDIRERTPPIPSQKNTL